MPLPVDVMEGHRETEVSAPDPCIPVLGQRISGSEVQCGHSEYDDERKGSILGCYEGLEIRIGSIFWYTYL